MRFAPPEEEVDLYKTGFNNDILDREKIGKTLSDIVDRIEDPLVIALDGAWGTGKSYFLKRWVGAHKTQNNGKATTVYFDAFANDYLSDPLISLLAEIGHRTERSKFDKVKKAAIAVAKPLARAALATISYGATEIANAAGDAAIKAIESESSKAIDRLWKVASGRHEGMKKFRQAIEGLTKPGDEDETPIPLVIVIDELDRCRPDYALELLEVIKHFFVVPHVHFVLGVNLFALENIVKTRYGLGIDATAYLQKFLSFTLKLPEHTDDQQDTTATIKYAAHLVSAMGIRSDLAEEVTSQIKIIAARNSFGLRDVSKIMSTSSIVAARYFNDRWSEGWLMALITLMIARTIAPEFAFRLATCSVADNDLKAFLGVTTSNTDDTSFDYDRNLACLYAAWSFIHGRSQGYMPEDHMKRFFGISGRSFDKRRMIGKIYHNCLNNFELR